MRDKVVACFYFHLDTWPSYSRELLGLKLAGAAGARNYDRSLSLQWVPNMIRA